MVLKREDLNHTGAHKINNTIGQALLARRMGKRRIIAETGAGQHGVATATVCAHFDLECVVYMGAEDVERQRLNVYRMQLLGATVVPVESGTRTLKDATNEALRDWVTNVPSTHYIIGSVVGPDPFPRMVRDFQSVIGREAREQMLARFQPLPHTVVACVGGGSNAMGIFSGFLDDAEVRLIGVEAAGEGLGSGHHSATLSAGSPGVLHGSLSYLLQDADGQVAPAHSISAGLDYPGVGPEHSYLRDTGRVSYETATDAEALAAFQDLCRLEGIIPALETAHALAWIQRAAGSFPPGGSGAGLPQRPGRQGCGSRRRYSGHPAVTAQPEVQPTTVPTAQVVELMAAMVKALRAFQIYLPNNPIHQRAIQNVQAACAPIWSGTEELVLNISESEFTWEDQVVYRQPNKNESLSWSLFKDGMRSVTIRRGAEEKELPLLLATINRARFLPPDAGDDLPTLLWEHEFEFIEYRFIDFFTGEGGGTAMPQAIGQAAGQGMTPADRKAQVAEEAPAASQESDRDRRCRLDALLPG